MPARSQERCISNNSNPSFELQRSPFSPNAYQDDHFSNITLYNNKNWKESFNETQNDSGFPVGTPQTLEMDKAEKRALPKAHFNRQYMVQRHKELKRTSAADKNRDCAATKVQGRSAKQSHSSKESKSPIDSRQRKIKNKQQKMDHNLKKELPRLDKTELGN